MHCKWRPIPLLSIWAIWKWRNRMIFYSKKEPFPKVFESIVCLYEKLDQPCQSVQRQGRISLRLFYGTALRNACACGVSIIPVDGQSFDIYWNGGPRTNNKAEIMALTGLLSIFAFLGLQNHHIFGDSKITIDHVLSKHIIKDIHLSGWLNRLEALWSIMKDYIISHIVRDKNRRVDALSKMRLSVPQGIWRMQVTVDSVSH